MSTMRSWERSSSGTTRSTEIKKAQVRGNGLLQEDFAVGQFLDRRVEGVDFQVTLGQRLDHLAVAIQERIGRPGQVLSDHGEQFHDLGFDSLKLAVKFLSFPSSR